MTELDISRMNRTQKQQLIRTAIEDALFYAESALYNSDPQVEYSPACSQADLEIIKQDIERAKHALIALRYL